MKYIRWGVTFLTFLAVAFLGLERLAAERVEVVELHTIDENGEEVTTRLWVVDDEGYQYLRVGSNGSGWFNRIEASDTIDVTRNGERASYVVELRREKSDRINDLMQEKYTWGDTFIGVMVGSRENSIPIELRPI